MNVYQFGVELLRLVLPMQPKVMKRSKEQD